MTARRAAALLAATLFVLAACDTDTRQAYTTVPPTATDAPPTTVAPATTCHAGAQAPHSYAYGYNPPASSGPTNLLTLDVYPLPKSCGRRPVLFWIHGGDWKSGDKRNQIAPKAALAAAYGWVLVSVNYRVSTPGSGVVWPTQGADVAGAIGYTLDHAGELGIDTKRVGVMGFTAGAQLAAMVAVDPTLLSAVHHARTDVRCLVALDPIGLSLTALTDAGDDATVALVTNAFGTDFNTYQQASPNFVLTQVKGKVADTLVITRGDDSREAVSADFVDLVRSSGAKATIVVADAYSSTDVSAAVGSANDTVVRPAITRFLTTCLG